jgi:hypothetical protein
VQVDARLDTGASFCIFERAYAEMLGLDLESGTKTLVSTANSTFHAFGHWLMMTVLALQFDVMVDFASDESIRRSVLGRRGFIDHLLFHVLRIVQIVKNGAIYLSKGQRVTTKIGITVPLELTNGTNGLQVDGWAELDRFNCGRERDVFDHKEVKSLAVEFSGWLVQYFTHGSKISIARWADRAWQIAHRERLERDHDHRALSIESP